MREVVESSAQGLLKKLFTVDQWLPVTKNSKTIKFLFRK